VKSAGTAGFLIVAFGFVVLGGAGKSAFGQRVQFPSEIPSVTVPGSGATLDGTIQPIPPECQPPQLGWDPYASPGAPLAPDSLWQSDPSYPSGMAGATAITFATATKFLQEVRIDYLWMPGTADQEFGINDIELTTTFAIPAFSNPDTPFLITPGFALHLWNGPAGLGAIGFDLPGQAYDAYLDTAWNPQITPWLGGELSFRIGVYSDFEKFTSDSVRYTGTGLIRLAVTPSFTIKGGIWYLDRQRIKMLPAGGIVWTPSSDVRCEIVFPNPKLAWHLTTYGTTQWWWYLRGEYGGGSWTIKQPSGSVDQIDYNDYRVATGFDFSTLNSVSGLFEGGVAFEREIYYTGANSYNLTTTVFLRTGLAY